MTDQLLIDDVAEMIIGTYWSSRRLGPLNYGWANPNPGSNGTVKYSWPSRQDLVDAVGPGVSGIPVFNRDNGTSDGVVNDVRIGGVMVFPKTADLRVNDDWENKADLNELVRLTKDLHESARSAGRLPPFICVDQEDGKTGLFEFGLLGSHLGNTDLRAAQTDVKEFARKVAERLAIAGLNVNLAPIADIVRPNSWLQGQGRGLGADAATVAAKAEAFALGTRQAGLLPCAKHLPGHGDTRCNSHDVVPVIAHEWPDVSQTDLSPFRMAAVGGAEIFLVGHLHFTALDPHFVVTQSPEALSKILLESGIGEPVAARDRPKKTLPVPLMITDDIDAMKAINYTYGNVPSGESGDIYEAGPCASATTRLKSTKEIVQNALRAGFDVIFCQYRWPEIFRALVELGEADEAGDRAKISQAATRVRAIKSALLDKKWEPPADLDRTLRSLDGLGQPSGKIDYKRPAALPFLLGPEPIWPQLDRYIGMGSISLLMREASLNNDPDDPVDRRACRVSGGAQTASLLVPHSSFLVPDPAISQEIVVDPTQFVSAGRDAGSLADSAYRTGEAASVIWDGEAQQASHLTIPMLCEGALLVRWGGASNGSEAGFLREPLYGAESPQGEAGGYLLTTSTDLADGELDPLWLRSPMPGNARFERYDHLVHHADGTVRAGPRSNVGRVVLRTPPLRTIPDALKLIDRDSPFSSRELRIVVEHVSADSVVDAWRPLLVHQARFFEDIYDAQISGMNDRATFHRQLRSQLGWLLRCWRAWIETTEPAGADPVPQEVASLGYSFRPPSKSKLAEALGTVVDGAGAMRPDLVHFIEGLYLPAIMGQPWHELDDAYSDFPSPDNRPPAHQEAYATLDAFRYAADSRWTMVYAGCPIGRPAMFWAGPETQGEGQDGQFDPSSYASTFDLEAMALIGALGSASTADPEQMRAAGSRVDLSSVGTWREAFPMAALRMVSPAAEPAYGTRAWLSELIAGAERVNYQVPLVNFHTHRLAGHPLQDWLEGLS